MTSLATAPGPSHESSLADVVEQVHAVLPAMPTRTVVIAARHCRRELDIENVGEPVDLAVVTARTLARLRASAARTAARPTRRLRRSSPAVPR